MDIWGDMDRGELLQNQHYDDLLLCGVCTVWATLITSQLPVTAWHAWLDEPTLADAILDRIVHGSHKIALKGEAMRKLSKAA
jgi:isochorismate hydrolase